MGEQKQIDSERLQWQVAAEEAGRTVQSLQAQISRLKKEHAGAMAVLRREQEIRTGMVDTIVTLRAEVKRLQALPDRMREMARNEALRAAAAHDCADYDSESHHLGRASILRAALSDDESSDAL